VPRRRRRGYPLAVLIGLQKDKATIWNIYSQSIKPDTVINRETSEYNFYEEMINKLRPSIKQGVKTIIVASLDKKNYEFFYDHVEKHQRWLIGGYELNRVILEYVEGSAGDLDSVLALVEESNLKRTVQKASHEDINRIMSVLEKRIGTPEGIETLLFTTKEVEEMVYGDVDPEYILLTTDFQNQHGRRIQRLLQIAQNKGIKTMIVEANTAMGKRLTQFGGLICMLHDFE
jgi:stalled ribosome rescue protein Dom34